MSNFMGEGESRDFGRYGRVIVDQRDDTGV